MDGYNGVRRIRVCLDGMLEGTKIPSGPPGLGVLERNEKSSSRDRTTYKLHKSFQNTVPGPSERGRNLREHETVVDWSEFDFFAITGAGCAPQVIPNQPRVIGECPRI